MRVHINFDVIEKNAKDYINFSKEINDIINDLNNSNKNIIDYWLSSNATIYDSQIKAFINHLQVDSNRMQRYGDVLLGINDDFKKTDLEYAKKSALNIEEDIYEFKKD